MMAIQNYGFFQMYFLMWFFIPVLANGDCDNMRFWVGFFALDCFVESFCCVWMAMGGFIGSPCMFTFGWLLHLIVALPYCISSVGIPYVLYNSGGPECRAAMGPAGLVLEPVVWVHIALFLVYVWCMLSITWYSFAKATFSKGGAAVNVA